MKTVIQKVQCVKIDKYYFRNSKGQIFKYSQFFYSDLQGISFHMPV